MIVRLFLFLIHGHRIISSSTVRWEIPPESKGHECDLMLTANNWTHPMEVCECGDMRQGGGKTHMHVYT